MIQICLTVTQGGAEEEAGLQRIFLMMCSLFYEREYIYYQQLLSAAVWYQQIGVFLRLGELQIKLCSKKYPRLKDWFTTNNCLCWGTSWFIQNNIIIYCNTISTMNIQDVCQGDVGGTCRVGVNCLRCQQYILMRTHSKYWLTKLQRSKTK